MKTITLLLSLVLGTTLIAQELPQLSPRSHVKQRVGLTDFEIDYSRPSVRDREVFGEMLPYDEVWRTGANSRTTFEVSHSIVIGEKELEAGKYGLLTIPGKEEWTIILTDNPKGWGEGDYNKENDVVRLKAKVQKLESKTETLWIGFDHMDTESAHFAIQFDDVRVAVPVKVHTEELAWKNIQTAIEEKPEDARVFRNAAGYAVKTGKKLDEAEEWIATSLELKESWYTMWVKAEVLHANGKTKEALKTGEKAIEMGKEANGDKFTYGESLTKEMKTWK